MQAIEKGSIDSSREAHADWLAKAQALLEGPQARGPALDQLSGPLASYAGSVQVRLSASHTMSATIALATTHSSPRSAMLGPALLPSHTV